MITSNSYDAKSCFLLCCLFPEDYDIQIEHLMKYGFGTGLFRDVKSTIENARVIANSVTKYLKACCLLLDSTKEGCVRMHDVVRDMAISIAMSVDGHASLVKTRSHLNDWSMDVHEGYSAISLIKSRISKFPSKLVCSKLQILLLQRNGGLRDMPKTFFQSLNDLRVLDLSNNSFCSLPPSFSLLTNLQALHLDYCMCVTDISRLRKLKRLEILSMKGCSIKKFPEEIESLTNLRMLDLTETVFETVPSQVISRLHKLEELYMNSSFGDWGGKIEGCSWCCIRIWCNNADFGELTGLSHLNTLEVSVCGAKCLPENVEFNPNWVNFYIHISRFELREVYFPHRSSRALVVTDTIMKKLPGWFISAVTEKTEDLWYRDSYGLTNLLEEHDRGRLHGLRYLSIDKLSKAKVLLNTIRWPRLSNEPVFEKLEELKIIFGHCLEELCVGELPPGSLCNLKILSVQSCYDIVKPLLPSKLLHMLQSLEKLDCSHMDKMKYVFGFEGHEAHCFVLTKLRMISLRQTNSLISIFCPSPPRIFQSLKTLYLFDCPKLEYLFTSDVAQCILQLEDLWVELCGTLDRLIEAGEETENKIILPQLMKIVLKDLPELKKFSSTSSSTVDIEIGCPSLEHLYMFDCPQFSISASDFNSSNQVRLNHDHQHFLKLGERILHQSTLSHFPLQWDLHI